MQVVYANSIKKRDTDGSGAEWGGGGIFIQLGKRGENSVFAYYINMSENTAGFLVELREFTGFKSHIFQSGCPVCADIGCFCVVFCSKSSATRVVVFLSHLLSSRIEIRFLPIQPVKEHQALTTK